MDRRRQEAEQEQLQNEIAQLRQALELEKSRDSGPVVQSLNAVRD